MLLVFGVFLIGLAWLLPGHYYPWAAFQQELAAAVGAAFIFGSAWWRARKHSLVSFPPLAVFAALVAVVPLAQWAAGHIHFFSDAILSAAYVAAFALCIASGSILAQSQDDSLADALITTLVIASIATGALALCQWQGISLGIYLTDLPPGGNPYGNFAQRNHQATLLALGIAGFLWLYETKRIGATATIFGLTYLGFGIVMTMSRTGWLFVAVLAVGYLVFRRMAGLRAKPMHVLIGVTLFIGMLFACAPLNELLLISSPQSLEERVSSQNLRLIHWRVLWDAALQSPWFGYGWSQVPLAQQVTVLDYPYTGEALSNSHNIILDLLIWNGLPLGFLIVAAIAAWFVRQFMMCRDSKRFSVLIGVVAVWLHGLLEYPLNYAYFLFPVGLLMGVIDGMSTRAWHLSLPPKVLAIFTAGLIVLGGYVAYEYAEVEATSRVMRFVAAGIGVDKVSDSPEPNVYLLDRPKEFHRYMIAQPRDGLSDAEILRMLHVSNMHPFASSLFRQALILGINGRIQEAQTTLKRLCWTHHSSRCTEAKVGWIATQQEFPKLSRVEFPDVTIP